MFVKTKTASGPDGLSSHMLRNTASAITSTLTKLFNKSLSTGVVPSEWKLSNITPVFKGKGDPCCVANYRPISLLSLPSKVLERIVHNRLLKYLRANNIHPVNLVFALVAPLRRLYSLQLMTGLAA